MQVYRRFVQLYLLSLPLFALSIVIDVFEFIYIAAFFLGCLYLLFEQADIQFDEQHSSQEHYQLHSRYNRINYLIAAMVVGSALLVGVIGPIRIYMALICWSLMAYFVNWMLPEYLLKQHDKMVVDYIHKQMPALSETEIIEIIENTQDGKPQHHVSESEAKNVWHYFVTYSEQ